MFKIIAFFIITLFARIMWGLVCGKHLHDCITSLSRSLGHEISLTPPVYIQVPVSSQESERSSGSCTKPGKWAVVRFPYQARKVSGRVFVCYWIFPLSTILLLYFRTVPTVWYFCSDSVTFLFRQCDIFVFHFY